MNVVAGKISYGLNKWTSLGAKVSHLTSNNLSVPKIILGSSEKMILVASGLHLEETSGPILLLSPEKLLPILKPILDKNIGFLIYPVINQTGLIYSETDSEKLLRYNDKGINYNDKWGMDEEKCQEVKLVENDILSLKGNISFAISIHEDSETPGKGYIYLDKIKKEKREKITEFIKSKIDNNLLAAENDLLEAGEDEFQGGAIENDFCIVDSKDEGSLETWLSNSLNIPTILSEGPFRKDLDTRINFHLAVLQSALSIF